MVWLEWLETSFKWETRSLVFVAVGVPLRFIHEPAAKYVMLLAVACIIVMVNQFLHYLFVSFFFHYVHTHLPPPFQDATFSFVVTAVFLRPIVKVMREGSVRQSAGYQAMQRAKWTTLIGSTFAVMSSTGLYVNVVFWALSDYGDPFFTDPLLNPFVTGINADSIANNLSMILVCGMLKPGTCGAILGRLSGTIFPSQQPLTDIVPRADLAHIGASNGEYTK